MIRLLHWFNEEGTLYVRSEPNSRLLDRFLNSERGTLLSAYDHFLQLLTDMRQNMILSNQSCSLNLYTVEFCADKRIIIHDHFFDRPGGMQPFELQPNDFEEILADYCELYRQAYLS